MLKGGDLSVLLPKLDVVAVYKLLRVLFCGLIVRANKLDCPEKTTVNANDERPIIGHVGRPLTRTNS
jgi:hypothetical protein